MRTVFVSGASAGFGVAVAERFAAAGDRVVIAARRADRLAALAERLGTNVLPIVLDVSERSGVQEAVASLPAAFAEIDVLADAQQDRVYVQHFRGAEPPGALAIRTVADWLAQPDAAAWVTGPGVRVLRGRVPAGSRTAAEADWDPRPESLLRLGLERLRRGERDDPFALEPLYLRPSSAEEKWASRGPERPG